MKKFGIGLVVLVLLFIALVAFGNTLPDQPYRQSDGTWSDDPVNTAQAEMKVMEHEDAARQSDCRTGRGSC